MDSNQNTPTTPNTSNDQYQHLNYIQMLTSPIQQQPLFTNISYQSNYFQQQRPQQFNQPQFQTFQQFQHQQFQTQSSQVPLSQSQPINLDNDDDNERVEETL